MESNATLIVFWQNTFKGTPNNYFDGIDIKHNIMELELAELCIKKIADSAFHQIFFLFCGGEPLTAGLDYYKKVIEFQRRYFKTEKVFINIFQSDISLLYEEFLHFAVRNSFNFYISLNNVDDDRIVKKIQLFNNYNTAYNMVINYNDLMVNDKIKIYSFLKSLKGLKNVEFLLPNPSLKLLNPENYSNLLSQLFDIWFTDYECEFNISLLSSMLLRLLGLPHSFSLFYEPNITERFLIIDPEGDVYPREKKSFMSRKIGNIEIDDINDLIYHNPIRKELNNLKIQRLEPCKCCEWFSFCNGKYYDTEIIDDRLFCPINDLFKHIKINLQGFSILNHNMDVKIDHTFPLNPVIKHRILSL